ncbi:MAG TPA: 1,4-dihydroxy-2-naphthoate polyprenyltransferase, partial [Burkholderiales bacterium]
MQPEVSRGRAWWLAARPRTLSISVAPVLVGTSIAWFDTAALHLPAALVALACAILIQVGTNLHNDAGDFERGADGPGRLGPPRASASGWLDAGEVRRAAAGCFAAAVALGLYIAWHAGWGIFALGLVSVAAGAAYTGGPRPIAYGPFGELFVWLFFGLVAVLGSYYIQAFSVSWRALAAASLVGLLAAAVIVVNNYRDLESDRQAGKRTLAVRIGRPASRVEYGLLVLAPLLLAPMVFAGAARSWAGALPLVLLPWGLALVRRLGAGPPGPWLNQLLARTAQ